MHFSLPGTLNIQSDTSSCSAINIAIMNRHPRMADSLQNSMRDFSRDSGPPHNSTYHVPKIMVANVMSLAQKMTEVQEFIDRNKVSLAFVTKTWLKSAVEDTVVDIPGFSIVGRDRASNAHGGVCLYIKDDYFRFKKLQELTCCKDREIPWVHLRPNRLPRDFSSLIVAVVYHPHWTKDENDSMRDHLFQSLSLAESRYANCALIVAGDFNRPDINSLKKHFRLKQVVKKPTRKNAILDLQSWTNFEKTAYLGGIFAKRCSRPILPSPSPWKQCCWVFKRKPDP